MKAFLKVLSWIGGVVLTLFGLLMLISATVGGLMFIVAGLFLLPPIRGYAFNITKRELSVQARGATVACLIFGAFIAIGISGINDADAKKAEEARQQAAAQAEAQQRKAEQFAANREAILAAANSSLTTGKFEEAIAQLSQYASVKDDQLQQTLATAKAGIELQTKKATEAGLLKEAKATEDDARLAEIYSKLATLFPDNKKYSQQRALHVKAVEDAKAKAAAEAARQKLIEQQFSAWDGSHINLERAIKKSMNDPDSYEHDETKYWDRGDHLVVLTQFRGRNGFGGMVRNTVKAKVDMAGNIIEVMDQY